MFEIVFGLLGGLALFIYGMQAMGDGLQKLAGKKMRRILEILTSVPIMGVVVGALVTAVVQSSSLTTVMAVGFVNASLMTLKQAISVIMGANIGTTITAQLVAFKITEYWYFIAGVGFVFYFFFKRKNIKNTGFIFFSLGVLLLGMVLMGDAMQPLSESEAFHNVMLSLSSNRVLGLLIGAAFTGLIQSSSATTGIIIAMAMQGLMPLDAALPLLFGSNIGTCVTALLASMGTGLSARRAAIAHLIFNVLGSLLFLIIMPLFQNLVLAISPADDIPRQIANAHTLFNVICTAVCLPLINQFTKLVMKLVPGEEKELARGPIYLDWNMVKMPAVAINLAQKELVRMGELAEENVQLAVEGYLERDEKKLKRMREQEDVVDELEKAISRYLAKISQSGMAEQMSVRHTGLLHAVNDVERVSDHADNIVDLAYESMEDEVRFSEQATAEIKGMYELVRKTFHTAIQALNEAKPELAKAVYELEEQVDTREEELRMAHIERLKNGTCQPEAGVFFLDIISNFERIGDHSTNIANVARGKIS